MLPLPHLTPRGERVVAVVVVCEQLVYNLRVLCSWWRWHGKSWSICYTCDAPAEDGLRKEGPGLQCAVA